MFDRFKGVYRPSDEEMTRWATRKANMPSLMETFRLIREICAGNSSMIGTVVAHVDNLTSRMRQLEEQTRAHLEILTALVDSQSEIHRKLETMQASLTVAVGGPSKIPAPETPGYWVGEPYE